MVAPIGVKFCMIVHIGPGQSSRLLGAEPTGIPKSEILRLNFGHLIANVSKTVSHSATCQLELNISSTRDFSKCKSQGSRPPGSEPPPRKARVAGLCLADALVINWLSLLFYAHHGLG